MSTSKLANNQRNRFIISPHCHPAAGLAYHAIVEDRGCADPLPAIPGGAQAVAGTVVCLYHPMGVDTALDVRAPTKCPAGETTVTAVDRTGGAIAKVPSTASSGGLVTFTAAGVFGATPVDHFVLRC